VNLAALSAVWARRKYLALGVLAATLAASLTIALAIPGIYRSTATVLVARPEMTTPSVRSPLSGELEARLNRIGEEILSRSRLEALLDRFDIYGPNAKTDLEATITRLRRDIRVDTKAVDLGTQGRGSTVAFAVTFRGRDPETVARVTNELAAYYVAENSTIRERRAAEAVQDVKREVDDAQKRLDEQDRRTNEFKRRNMGQLPEQVAANLAMLERLNAQVALNNHNQVVAMERRTAFRRHPDADLQAASTPEEALTMRLHQLNTDLVKLQRQYSDKYPDVINTKREIETTKRQLAELGPTPTKASTASAKPSRDPADTDIAALKAEDERLRRMITAYQSRVEMAPEREQELQQLSRDYRATREMYDTVLKRYHDAQAAVDVERRRAGEEFQILEKAVPAREPWAPNRAKLILLGVVLACAVTGAAVMLAEQLDTSFHGVDDLRSFSKLPVLVTIPEITTRADRTRRRWRMRLAACAGVVGVFLIVGIAYVSAHNDLLVSLLTRTGS
jgi:polysaccharide chain length determinant protein (PEP-CTERM system associated)